MDILTLSPNVAKYKSLPDFPGNVANYIVHLPRRGELKIAPVPSTSTKLTWLWRFLVLFLGSRQILYVSKSYPVTVRHLYRTTVGRRNRTVVNMEVASVTQVNLARQRTVQYRPISPSIRYSGSWSIFTSIEEHILLGELYPMILIMKDNLWSWWGYML